MVVVIAGGGDEILGGGDRWCWLSLVVDGVLVIASARLGMCSRCSQLRVIPATAGRGISNLI